MEHLLKTKMDDENNMREETKNQNLLSKIFRVLFPSNLDWFEKREMQKNLQEDIN